MRLRYVVLVVMATSGLAQAELIYGVTNQTLVRFDSATPGNITLGAAITGLATNETIRGLDFRPATGELYALGSFSNLYRVNANNGAATLVGSGPFSPTLNGSAFGFDFNPMIDRIRIVSDANQNLVVNPITGVTQLVATNLAYLAGDPNAGADPNVVGSAYDNNFVGTAATQLYGIDTGLDILVRQANNAGTLTTVGSLGANITNLVGFDISGTTNIAYAASQEAGGSISMLWTINLTTGAAAPLGQIGGGTQIDAMTVVPAPGTAVLIGLAAAGVVRRKRA